MFVRLSRFHLMETATKNLSAETFLDTTSSPGRKCGDDRKGGKEKTVWAIAKSQAWGSVARIRLPAFNGSENSTRAGREQSRPATR